MAITSSRLDSRYRGRARNAFESSGGSGRWADFKEGHPVLGGIASGVAGFGAFAGRKLQHAGSDFAAGFRAFQENRRDRHFIRDFQSMKDRGIELQIGEDGKPVLSATTDKGKSLLNQLSGRGDDGLTDNERSEAEGGFRRLMEMRDAARKREKESQAVPLEDVTLPEGDSSEAGKKADAGKDGPGVLAGAAADMKKEQSTGLDAAMLAIEDMSRAYRSAGSLEEKQQLVNAFITKGNLLLEQLKQEQAEAAKAADGTKGASDMEKPDAKDAQQGAAPKDAGDGSQAKPGSVWEQIVAARQKRNEEAAAKKAAEEKAAANRWRDDESPAERLEAENREARAAKAEQAAKQEQPTGKSSGGYVPPWKRGKSSRAQEADGPETMEDMEAFFGGAREDSRKGKQQSADRKALEAEAEAMGGSASKGAGSREAGAAVPDDYCI